MSEFILEAAQVATPVTVEENIRRGRIAMKHVIDTAAKEYHAMYRKELGWIAFSWGTPGTPPPDFKSKKEAAEWWANLPGKTNGQKGSKVFSGGRGVSHIIAKRDWEAKWMDSFEGQRGEDVAMKCVEAIARGVVSRQRAKRTITYGKIVVSLVADSHWIESRELRAKGKKKEEFWVLSGFEIVDNDEEYGITESADEAGVPRTLHRPTHTAPFADRCCMGAANSLKFDDVMESRVHHLHPTHIMPTVTRHDVGAANFLETTVGHGSATHQNEGMLVALRHSPSPLKGEPPKPTHTGAIVGPPRMGAADSIEKRVPDSPTLGKPLERKVPEYGTGAYGFMLDL